MSITGYRFQLPPFIEQLEHGIPHHQIGILLPRLGTTGSLHPPCRIFSSIMISINAFSFTGIGVTSFLHSDLLQGPQDLLTTLLLLPHLLLGPLPFMVTLTSTPLFRFLFFIPFHRLVARSGHHQQQLIDRAVELLGKRIDEGGELIDLREDRFEPREDERQYLLRRQYYAVEEGEPRQPSPLHRAHEGACHEGHQSS
ncbi:hypothetical protein MUK42_35168 [Musa troglodytarum]|uniref:Uncharacterized protein n=1 Tax=Musa troglodytarum TaxID=320322 RepID=A0A9E7L166_9LILI|nr:hypothetical protein MUK42_35168 [Musa troglodytarum]